MRLALLNIFNQLHANKMRTCTALRYIKQFIPFNKKFTGIMYINLIISHFLY